MVLIANILGAALLAFLVWRAVAGEYPRAEDRRRDAGRGDERPGR